MDIIHAFDQLQATLKDFAPVLASYHKQLVENGLTREEATQVVIAWQRDVFNKQG